MQAGHGESAPQTRVYRNRRRGGRVLPSPGSFELADFSYDQVAPDAPQPIDEQRTVEMIHLVLKRAGEQLAPFDGVLGTRTIEAPDNGAQRTNHRGVEAGY